MHGEMGLETAVTAHEKSSGAVSRSGRVEAHSRVNLVSELTHGSAPQRMLDHGALSAVAHPLVDTPAPAPARSRAAAREADGDVDAALVLAIRAGDRTAEEHLYRRHAASVLALATRLLRARDEAMDVLQDTFVVAFESLGDLRDPAAFRAWILRVAVRLVHRRFRRNKLLGLLGLGWRGEEISLDELADSAASPEARAELRWLDRALAAVRDPERVAWMLRHVEGMSLDEVAEACACSLATAKRRIAAADAVVRAHFADQGGAA